MIIFVAAGRGGARRKKLGAQPKPVLEYRLDVSVDRELPQVMLAHVARKTFLLLLYLLNVFNNEYYYLYFFVDFACKDICVTCY